MRIISGIHKGRRIIAPKNLPVRPTTDRAKEALFNILQHQLTFDQLSVLDLFAGIGSVSLEFASRGTPTVVAVDQHPKCVRFISDTAATLQLPIRVIKQEATTFVDRNHQNFDVVFMDPPYAFSEKKYTELMDAVFENPATTNALLIAEHDTNHSLTTHPHFVACRNYGNSAFSFFEKK